MNVCEYELASLATALKAVESLAHAVLHDVKCEEHNNKNVDLETLVIDSSRLYAATLGLSEYLQKIIEEGKAYASNC